MAHSLPKSLSVSPSGLSIAFLAILLTLLVLQHALTAPVDLIEFDKTIRDDRKLAIELFMSRTDLLATWAIAIIGALAFIFNYFEDRHKGTRDEIMMISFITFVLALVSVFCSHIVSNMTLRALLSHGDPFSNESLGVAAKAQYYSLMLSLSIFVCFSFYLASGSKDART